MKKLVLFQDGPVFPLWFFVIYFLFHVLWIIFYVAKHEMLWLRLRRKLWWFYLESYLVAPARSLISLPLCLPCIRRSLLINRRVSATHKSREEYTRSIFKGGFPNPQVMLRQLRLDLVMIVSWYSKCELGMVVLYLSPNFPRVQSYGKIEECIMSECLRESYQVMMMKWSTLVRFTSAPKKEMEVDKR